MRTKELIIAALLAMVLLPIARAGELAPQRAAEVTFVAGPAYIEIRGVRRPVKLGDAVSEGNTLFTEGGGHIHLQTVDKGFLSLRPNTRASVEIYRYNIEAPENTAIRLQLEGGVVRSISGQGAQSARQNFRLNTPVAAIGIKGTDFTVLADSGVTRAVVNSGAIVVSGYGNGCVREALGPCAGDGALLLTAQQAGKLLEIHRGQQRPVLLDSKGAGGPDQVAPPAPIEPAGKAEDKVSSQIGGQAVRISLEKQVFESVRRESALPVSQAVPEQPFVAQVNWGRWSSLATTDQAGEFVRWLKQNGELVGMNTSYFIARSNQDPLVMPQTGVYGFKLDQAEAIMRDRGVTRAAIVDGGQLAVDFGKQQFSTSLNVTADAVKYQLDARGVVTPDGKLNGNYPLIDPATNTFVSGAVAGNNASQAGYVFERAFDEGKRSILGVTTWRR